MLQGGKVRFRGSLGGWLNPDLDRATTKALVLGTADGGSAEVAWATISPADLLVVGQLVLKDDFDVYRAAVNVLTQAKVGAEK